MFREDRLQRRRWVVTSGGGYTPEFSHPSNSLARLLQRVILFSIIQQYIDGVVSIIIGDRG